MGIQQSRMDKTSWNYRALRDNKFEYSFRHLPKDSIIEIFAYWLENCGGGGIVDFLHFNDRPIIHLKREEDLMLLKLRFG